MASSTSLTDAVKAAATHGASLTDAVKEAARSGTDATVISFPRAVPDLRPQTAVPVVLPAPTARPEPDAAAHEPLEPAPEPDLLYLSEFQKEPAAEPVSAPPRKFRLRAGTARGPRPLARMRSGLRRLRGALPGRAALGAFAAGCKVAAVKLAGFAIFVCLAMVAVPSPVGSGSDAPIPIAAQKRVALVIGNSAYRYTRRLENPRNDAADIGAALQRLGFQTIEGFDL
ncbi:MAG TPA: caspase family protein, partial [Hyphomicrobiaceae bacterium]